MRQDLVAQILKWRKEGDKLILMLDGNANLKDGQLAHMFQNSNLDMKEAVKFRTHIYGPVTLVRGSRQIDAAWVTPDIEIGAAYFLLFF